MEAKVRLDEVNRPLVIIINTTLNPSIMDATGLRRPSRISANAHRNRPMATTCKRAVATEKGAKERPVAKEC